MQPEKAMDTWVHDCSLRLEVQATKSIEGMLAKRTANSERSGDADFILTTRRGSSYFKKLYPHLRTCQEKEHPRGSSFILDFIDLDYSCQQFIFSILST